VRAALGTVVNVKTAGALGFTTGNAVGDRE
jgi:hypothetical protein